MTARGIAAACAVVVGVACSENATGPGRCPDFCPTGTLTLVDTLLTTAIERDTAFRGYLEPADAPALIAAELPGVVDSRPIMRFTPIGRTFQLPGSDTVHYPIVVTDSARVTLTLIRRDTSAGNLRLRLYRLPITIDSTTAFGGLATEFSASPVRVINVDSLVQAPNHRDTVTRDSVFVGNDGTIRVMLMLDSAQARFVVADSGTLAYGVRIAADTATTAALASNEADEAPLINWYFSVDSAGTTVHATRAVSPDFDTYLLNPPSAPLDSTLTVGGMPTVRSLLRVVLPPRLRDSTQILRATLLLFPSTPARGIPADSFTLVAHAVAADLGGKSPLLDGADSSYLGTGTVRINSTDTVQVDITRILRRWSGDSTAATAFVLHSASEGIVLTEIRFEPSGHPLLRPTIRLTYASHFPFGLP